MKYVIASLATALALSWVPAANAGVPEVLAAEQAVLIAKERAKALKAGLTKVEKAELAVAMATIKLAKAKGE